MDVHALSERRRSNYRHDSPRTGGDSVKKIEGFGLAKASGSKQASKTKTTTQHEKSRPPSKPAAVKWTDGSPNYMKPTRSSDARKDALQVPLSPLAKNDKPESMGNSYVNTSSTNNLATKDELKLKKPAKANRSGASLRPENICKGTCSSTLKDFKVKKTPDLKLGAPGSEGNSATKVCRVPYCSLNGHEPTPPKPAIGRRGMMLRTHKSIKMRGLPSSRKKSFRIAKKENKSNSTIPRVEENSIGFLLNLSAQPSENSEPADTMDRSTQQEIAEELCHILEILSTTDYKHGDEMVKVNDLEAATSLLTEIYSDISYGNDLEPGTSISTEETDVVLTSPLKNIDNNLQGEGKEEHCSCLAADDSKEWVSGCFVMNGPGSENIFESNYRMPAKETAESSFEGEETSPSAKTKSNTATYNADREFSFDLEMTTGDEEVTKSDVVMLECSNFNGDYVSSSCKGENENPERNDEHELSLCREIAAEDEIVGKMASGKSDSDFDYASNLCEGMSDRSSCNNQSSNSEKSPRDVLCFGAETEIVDEIKGAVTFDRNEEATYGFSFRFDYSDENGKSVNKAHYDNLFHSGSMSDKITEEHDGIEVEGDDYSCSEEKYEAVPENEVHSSLTRKMIEEGAEEEDMAKIKQRTLNFLPIEADPEKENVHLRQTTTEGRKNAAAWLTDYAMQQVVTKLAPDHQKNVEILVEAFETVVPLGMSSDTPLLHPSSD